MAKPKKGLKVKRKTRSKQFPLKLSRVINGRTIGIQGKMPAGRLARSTLVKIPEGTFHLVEIIKPDGYPVHMVCIMEGKALYAVGSRDIIASVFQKAFGKKTTKVHSYVAPKKKVFRQTPRSIIGVGALYLDSYFAGNHSLPLFNILSEDGRVKAGMIARGHVNVYPDFRRQGVFSEALRELEAVEKQGFDSGSFQGYKGIFVKAVGKGISDAYKEHIMNIKKPTHLDFSHTLDTVRALLRNDYKLSMPTLEILEARGLPKGADAGKIAGFLNDKRDFGGLLFLLEKPA